MRLSLILPTAFLTLCSVASADSNLTKPLSSHQILPTNFKPPEVFKNINCVRSINLEKGYIRTLINVVIENTDKNPQTEYFIPFSAETVGKVGGFEVHDKKSPAAPGFHSDLVEYDPYSQTQYYRITLPIALAPSTQQTLSITYHVLSNLNPLPASITQADKQYLQHVFSLHLPSLYPTLKQKTKLKFPNTDVPSSIPAPNEKQGSSYTYGPYDNIPAGSVQDARVRYEFTKPILHTTLLKRDIEISHWGGNLATEERYWLTNIGATLSTNFDRVLWARMINPQGYNPPTSALKQLNIPLKSGSLNPYFTDDIGNVSTSRFRSNLREAHLELKPRYPVFGGWKYSFRVGWDAHIRSFLRKVKAGDGYVLKVPFLEGPKMGEGIGYEKVDLRIILPEGATNVKYETAVPLVASEISLHKTFMDTVGRTTLKLSAVNVIDESRDRDLIVTYDYPVTASFRKPITISVGVLAVFAAAWGIGKLDVGIGKAA